MPHGGERLLRLEESLLRVEPGRLQVQLGFLVVVLGHDAPGGQGLVAIERIRGISLHEPGPLDARQCFGGEQRIGNLVQSEACELEFEAAGILLDRELEIGGVDFQQQVTGRHQIADVAGHPVHVAIDLRADLDLLEPVQRAHGADAPLDRSRHGGGHRHGDRLGMSGRVKGWWMSRGCRLRRAFPAGNQSEEGRCHDSAADDRQEAHRFHPSQHDVCFASVPLASDG